MTLGEGESIILWQNYLSLSIKNMTMGKGPGGSKIDVILDNV